MKYAILRRGHPLGKPGQAVPTEFICRCGSKVMSPTNEVPLTKRDKVSSRMVEWKCPCGGAFNAARPLKVIPIHDIAKMRIHCRPCKVSFRRVVTSRFSCTCCSETAVIHEKALWLFATADVSVDYEQST